MPPLARPGPRRAGRLILRACRLDERVCAFPFPAAIWNRGTVVGVMIGHYRPLPPLSDEDSAGTEATDDATSCTGRIHGVWYGKILNLDGTFRAYARGVYGRSHHKLGVFRGHYLDVDGEVLGRAFGRWSRCPIFRGGPMFGFWNGTGEEPPVDEVE